MKMRATKVLHILFSIFRCSVIGVGVILLPSTRSLSQSSLQPANPCGSSSSSSSSGRIHDTPPKSSNIRYIPSRIYFNEVSQSYPVTFFRTLFSSIPKREYALEQITTSFGFMEDKESSDNQESGKINLLIGASSSGKTTILRLVAGLETPTQGKILLNGHDITKQTKQTEQSKQKAQTKASTNNKKYRFYTKPIIIDSKPDFTTLNDSKNVEDWIQQSSGLLSFTSLSTNRNRSELFVKELTQYFAKTLTFTKEQLQGKPSSLTPSKQYLFGLACACVQSICSTLVAIDEINTSEDSNQLTLVDIQNKNAMENIDWDHVFQTELHCPILLLDELLDTEVSSVAQQVFQGLQQLTDMGGLVICVTHKPNFFLKNAPSDSNQKKRVITLSAGKILTDIVSS